MIDCDYKIFRTEFGWFDACFVRGMLIVYDRYIQHFVRKNF